MERDLQVLVNTNDRLVVDSPAASLGTLNLVLLAVGIAVAGYLVYRLWPVSRIAAVVTVVIALAVGWLVFADLGTSYRMELNRGKNELIMNSYRGKNRTTATGTWVDPLDALERADIEFDRRYRRITMTSHDGQVIHPLGPDFTIMDSQFQVLGEIQRFLGQEPTARPAQ